jgi:rubrerythrin
MQQQLELETAAAQALRKESRDIDHPGIKVLVEVCAADSTKHAAVITLLLESLEKGELLKETFVSTWKQRHKGLEAIKDHINRETQMINLLKEQILATQDKTLKMLLKHILADEERHHKILTEEIWQI